MDDRIWRIVIGMGTRFPMASLAVKYSVRLGFAIGSLLCTIRGPRLWVWVKHGEAL